MRGLQRIRQAALLCHESKKARTPHDALKCRHTEAQIPGNCRTNYLGSKCPTLRTVRLLSRRTLNRFRGAGRAGTPVARTCQDSDSQRFRVCAVVGMGGRWSACQTWHFLPCLALDACLPRFHHLIAPDKGEGWGCTASTVMTRRPASPVASPGAPGAAVADRRVSRPPPGVRLADTVLLALAWPSGRWSRMRNSSVRTAACRRVARHSSGRCSQVPTRTGVIDHQ